MKILCLMNKNNTLITIFYFNGNILITKSLMVCINYALLGFYLCHFQRYECVKKINCV